MVYFDYIATNCTGLFITELDERNETIKLKDSDGRKLKRRRLYYTTKGDIYFLIYGKRYFLSEFIRKDYFVKNQNVFIGG